MDSGKSRRTGVVLCVSLGPGRATPLLDQSESRKKAREKITNQKAGETKRGKKEPIRKQMKKSAGKKGKTTKIEEALSENVKHDFNEEQQ